VSVIIELDNKRLNSLADSVLDTYINTTFTTFIRFTRSIEFIKLYIRIELLFANTIKVYITFIVLAKSNSILI
jgi:hypothetical protein